MDFKVQVLSYDKIFFLFYKKNSNIVLVALLYFLLYYAYIQYNEVIYLDSFFKALSRQDTRDINKLLENKVNINPLKESLLVASVYFIFGFNWILWSDTVLVMFVKNIETLQKIQLIKGWLYVLISAGLIYFIVRVRTRILLKTLYAVEENQNKLKIALSNLFESEEKLKNTLYFDSLTNLPSRLGLELVLDTLIKENSKFALLHINFDNFNHINETLGHGAGDEFLVEMSKKIKTIVGNSMVGRFGADEFGVIIKDYESQEKLKELITDSLKNIEKIWTKNNYDYFISFCVGISLYPEDGLNKTLILRNGDLALKKAKNEGKSRIVFYSGEIFKYNLEKIRIKNQLDFAIEKNELILYFQPQYMLKTGEIKGMEVLLRWISPSGFVPPDLFIPIAEESGQIFNIEKWVFENALQQKKKFEDMGFKNFDLSINLSSKTLMSSENFEDLLTLIKSTDLDYKHVVFEITETDIISDLDLAISQLLKLKEFGIKIALDDFGTGFSSLNHLKKLPIDIIKLDKSFIKSIEKNQSDTYIIKSLLLLALDLGHDVVAEGVETKEQYDFLNGYNCKYAQGYFMSKPLPIEEIYKIIKAEN